MNQETLLTMIAISVVALLAAFWYRKQAKISNYNRLLRKCFGDVEQAERLITAEAKRYPGASRERLIRHVLDRWDQHSH